MTKFLGVNISDELDEAIAQRIAETKKTKTEIVTTALEKELGIQKNATLGDRVEIIEKELDELKQEVSEIKKKLDA